MTPAQLTKARKLADNLMARRVIIGSLSQSGTRATGNFIVGTACDGA